MNKTCTLCGDTRPLADFRKARASKDGHGNWCPPCARKKDAEYRAKRDPERVKKTRSKWIKGQREKRREYQRRWREENPEKYKAHNWVQTRVRNGTIVKPDACQFCHAKGVRIEAAHGDYSQPEKFLWLCVPCHRRIDDNPVANGSLATPEQRHAH